MGFTKWNIEANKVPVWISSSYFTFHLCSLFGCFALGLDFHVACVCVCCKVTEK